MDDQSAVAAEIAAADAEGREISDGCARTIASWYSGDRESYAFTSTGTITESGSNTYRHIVAMRGDGRSLYDQQSPEDKRALDFLGTYLVNAGERGPVEGCSEEWVR